MTIFKKPPNSRVILGSGFIALILLSTFALPGETGRNFDSASAQGFVRGVVMDAETRTAIGSATIWTTGDVSTTSLSNGGYMMVHPTGAYTMTAEAPGYHSMTYSNVEVFEAESTAQNFELEPSGSTTTVTSSSTTTSSSSIPSTSTTTTIPGPSGSTVTFCLEANCDSMTVTFGGVTHPNKLNCNNLLSFNGIPAGTYSYSANGCGLALGGTLSVNGTLSYMVKLCPAQGGACCSSGCGSGGAFNCQTCGGGITTTSTSTTTTLSTSSTTTTTSIPCFGHFPGFIEGLVTDADSKVPIESTIVWTNYDLDYISATSLSNGAYLIIHPTGTYTVTADAPGYNSKNYSNVNVCELEATAQDFQLVPLLSRSVVIYVGFSGICGGNTPCYSTIQEAIDAANSGATIKIIEGSYNEDLTLNTSENLTLSGGWDSTFTTQSSTSTAKSITISNSDGTVQVDKIILK